MCVNRCALRVEINAAAILVVEKFTGFHFESIKNLYHRGDTRAHFNIFLMKMQQRNIFLAYFLL